MKIIMFFFLCEKSTVKEEIKSLFVIPSFRNNYAVYEFFHKWYCFPVMFKSGTCPSDNMMTFTNTQVRKLLWTPGYPTRYPANIKCYWFINSTVPNTRISAYIQDFKLESAYDWWTAGDGDNIKDSRSLLAKLSGDLEITRVMSTSNKMWIEFKSDDRVNKAGFWLYIQPIAGKGKDIIETV